MYSEWGGGGNGPMAFLRHVQCEQKKMADSGSFFLFCLFVDLGPLPSGAEVRQPAAAATGGGLSRRREDDVRRE